MNITAALAAARGGQRVTRDAWQEKSKHRGHATTLRWIVGLSMVSVLRANVSPERRANVYVHLCGQSGGSFASAPMLVDVAQTSAGIDWSVGWEPTLDDVDARDWRLVLDEETMLPIEIPESETT